MSALHDLVRGSDEDGALLDTLVALGTSTLARGGDQPIEHIEAARDALVSLGFWSVGFPEPLGGGADGRTVALITAGVAREWPAIALALTHAHGAAAMLGGCQQFAGLLQAIADGAPVAVVELPRGVSWEVGIPVTVPRIDVGSDNASIIIVLDDQTVAVVPPARTSFGQVQSRTGLDGARTVAAAFVPAADLEVFGACVSEGLCVIRRGLVAVAAGISDAAADGAIDYARTRIQFGEPLTSLPAMRDTLFRLRSGAFLAATAALTDAQDPWAGLALLDRALDLAIDVAADAVQAHGGYGYLREYPAEALLRDAVSLRAVADSWNQRERAAMAMFGAGK